MAAFLFRRGLRPLPPHRALTRACSPQGESGRSGANYNPHAEERAAARRQRASRSTHLALSQPFETGAFPRPPQGEDIKNAGHTKPVMLRSARRAPRSTRALRGAFGPPQGDDAQFVRVGRSVAELLGENALGERMTRIEHHENVDAALLDHLNAYDIAKLGVVGHRAHGTLLGLEHLDDDLGVI